MKFLIGLILVCGVVFGLLYYGGGFSSYDPTEQGEKAKAAIQPGMSWTKVIADNAAGEPRYWQPFIVKTRTIGGETMEEVVPGPQAPFAKDNIENRIAEDSLQEGFLFIYEFSQSVAFDVIFDSAGNVEKVRDKVTMKDMLQM